MKKIFVSVPIKLLMLVVGALMLLSAGFSILSLTRLNQEFNHYQADNLHQGRTQFNLHSQILRENIRTWLESLTNVLQVNKNESFDTLTLALDEQFDVLQINKNVNNIWLLHQNGDLLYSSKNLPFYALNSIGLTLEQQAPQHQIYCLTSCEQLITVPILNGKGEIAVVAITVSLIDMIYAINRAIKSEIAIVSYANSDNVKFNQADLFSTSNTPLFNSLFSQQSNDKSLLQVIVDGVQIESEEGHFLINLMPLSVNDDKRFYMVLIDDVTPFNIEYSAYRLQFLLSSFLIFFTLAILVYFVSSPFTYRLINLADALPLLAKKEFNEFRRSDITGKHIVTDELDILADSVIELSYELEQLNLEVEQKTKELENIAMFDLLTGLPNRNMLNYQLRKSVINLAKEKQNVTVLFLDLDDFKKVNDSHGHEVGDRLLIEAANRIKLSVRPIDIVSRFGGDEFVIILGALNDANEAKVIADIILTRFKEPIKLGESLFYVSTSIGIAYTEKAISKSEDLISHADMAMYEAKDQGGDQYHTYHDDMYQRVANRVMLEGEVRQALAKKQFSLSLQPQIRAKDNRLYGFEALLRWNHPERGLVSPDDFIPILESSEHMVELGYWVIKRCFEQMSEFIEYGLLNVRLAINLSAVQFMDANLPSYLEELLKEHNLTATLFELELTEQTLVKDMDRAIEMMDQLKLLGFSFAIDDFGTGYSSLAYIKRMPVDVIKIDKSFVFGMLENDADYQIIMSTIAMVKNLGLQVIAEGVETAAQLRSLSENNCDLIQGYYFAKPIPETELLDFIKRNIVKGYWKTKAQ